ncbi:non-ribosomal peptide synthetase [Massilia sp. Root335]|uniref:non-ribosomal peptide synthetase n=1 Tax=Massilia sp. Root335 TaxID=1736517 RepID=UPI0012F6852B|nr:non-ribosomal peptide synthetase [Massilia sp. Root335]
MDGNNQIETTSPVGAVETSIAAVWRQVLCLSNIGRNNSFSELGGNAESAKQAATQINRLFQVNLSAGLIAGANSLSELAKIIRIHQKHRLTPIRKVSRDIASDLSLSQQRLWFLSQLDNASRAYNVPVAVRLKGYLNTRALNDAICHCIERHEILRTQIVEVSGVGLQRVLPDFGGFELQCIDFTQEETSDNIQHRLDAQMVEEAAAPFDLETHSPIRGKLMKIADDDHILMLTLHHIAVDGRSMSLLKQEISQLYLAFSTGAASPLRPLQIQYVDYAVWQRQWLTKGGLASQLNYWRDVLANAPPVLELPTDHVRPSKQDFHGRSIAVEFDSTLSARLRSLSKSCGVSLFMTVLTGWAIVLAKISGQSDIVIGVPVANRQRPETEDMIGLFVNTIPLRIVLPKRKAIAELLVSVREAMLDASENQDVPLDQIVESVNPNRSPGISPLFQVAFGWKDGQGVPITFPGVEVTEIEIEDRTAKFDLTLELEESAKGIAGTLNYACALFDAETIRRHISYLRQTLTIMAADQQHLVDNVSLLTDSERHTVLEKFNSTAIDFLRKDCVHQLFEEQVSTSPNNVALVFCEQQLTYKELNAKSNELAYRLIAAGIGPGQTVALFFERGMESIVSMLAALKAGSAYVPIDSTYPIERIANILDDSKPAVLLTHGLLRDRVLSIDTRVLIVDLDTEPVSSHWDNNPVVPGLSSSSLAYVIYTSGSTGQPKGVMIEHRGVTNLALTQRQLCNIGLASRMLQAGSLSFDISVFECMVALCNGARLYLATTEQLRPGEPLKRTLQHNRITHTILTPSTVAALGSPVGLPFLEVLIMGGEICPPELARRWGKATKVFNAYGPTEITVVASMYDCNAHTAREISTVPIGTPISNTRIYILDGAGKPVPIGTVGELYVGGAGVARGYLNRTDLTAERFPSDPFSNEANAVLYKTGDLARWLSSGVLEYIGRNDQQIKLRGFRIELSEVESKIAAIGGIRDCAVILRDDFVGEKRMVAYVCLENGADISPLSIRTCLLATLPDYMVPSSFVTLESLPLNVNGKLDRQALPAPDEVDYAIQRYVAPSTPEEEILIRIYRDVLRINAVGANDSFFALGGHSLQATRLAARIREEFSVELPVQVVFETPVVRPLAERLKALQASEQGTLVPPLTAQLRETRSPASYAQERLWFLDQLHSENAAYNVSIAFRLEGKLDIVALKGALALLIERHETLRTRFESTSGECFQVTEDIDRFVLSSVDLTRIPIMMRQGEALRIMKDESTKRFDLSSAPLFRACAIKVDEFDHVLVMTTHHIVSDGWSLDILLSEFSALYSAFREGRRSPLPPLSVQYADYAIWQRSWLKGEVLKTQLAYWKQQLAGSPPALELPTDFPRPPISSNRGAVISFAISKDATLELTMLAKRESATLYMVMLAAFQALLSRWSRQEDIVVGSPIAGRTVQATEGLIGFFVNTLAIRLNLSGKPSFVELLARTRKAVIAAQHHQDVPFERVIQELDVDRNLSRHPLFQVMFAFQNISTVSMQLSGLTVSKLATQQKAVKFDLSMNITETDFGLRGELEYSTELFDSNTMERFLEHFKNLIEGIVADPYRCVERFSLLSSLERSRVLKEFNSTVSPYPADKCVHQLFEEQVSRAPEADAVVFEGRSLTYKELNIKANQLAHHLISIGVKSNDRVGLYVERGVTMITALLGILKAGAVYVPLDPNYAIDRLSFMIDDCNPSVLLVQENLVDRLPVNNTTKVVINADSSFSGNASNNPDVKRVPVTPEDLAYIIYTSGSTGNPKGVMVQHRSLVNYTCDAIKWFTLTQKDVVLQQNSLNFDLSLEEIFPALLSGATLAPTAELFGTNEYQSLAPTVVHLTAAHWHQLVSKWQQSTLSAYTDLGNVRLVNVTGDLLAVGMVELWERVRPKHVVLINTYGPTETTISCTASYVRTKGGSRRYNVGKLFANSSIYILDQNAEPTPIGVIGEIYIGGPGVAQGYYNRPELTAEKFLLDTFCSIDGARMYRSGDLGRWLPDGNVEFLGRNDYQVKIHGFRLELGEVEAKLLGCPGVSEAVAVAREDKAGDKQLVAYVTCKDNAHISAATLHDALALVLPDYMVPSAFVILTEFPLTPNGKLDRRALPAPNQAAFVIREYVPPIGAVESEVASVWGELLRLERVGRHDHFFDLGGHSLLSVRVISRLRQSLGVDISLRDVFAFPVMHKLAQVIADRKSLPDDEIVSVDRNHPLPLSPAQRRLWFLDQLDQAAGTAYNIPIRLRLDGELHLKSLQEALDRLVARHETLRTRYVNTNEDVHQVVGPETTGFNLLYRDLSALSTVCQNEELDSIGKTDLAKRFDLENGPLIRGQLLRLSEASHVLLITQHHIASDGWSLNIFLQELAALYEAREKGTSELLPNLRIQYADYAIWQRKRLEGDALKDQQKFWLDRLAGGPAVLDLPTDRPRPPIQSYRGGFVELSLPDDLIAELRRYSLRHDVTLFMTLLTGWAVLISHLSGERDLVIGVPVANRLRAECEVLIGLFVNTLPLRIQIDENWTTAEFLSRVKDFTTAAYENQELPFEQIVELLNPPRSLSYNPVFQVMFSLDNSLGGAGLSANLPDLTIRSLPQIQGTAKFDLTLALDDQGATVRGHLVFASDLFDRATAERIASQFQDILVAMVENENQTLDRINVFTPNELNYSVNKGTGATPSGESGRKNLGHTWSVDQTTYPRHKQIHELFEYIAGHSPDDIAVVCQDEKLRYGEVNERANRLAHYLRNLGVDSDNPVGLCVERGFDMIIGMLAILKAGGAYVPLDSEYPQHRLSYMIGDSGIKVILTQGALKEKIGGALEVEPNSACVMISLDAVEFQKTIAKYSTQNPGNTREKSSNKLAYVIYTSGSTGEPKGVMVEHSGVVRLAIKPSYVQLNDDSVFIQLSSISFDAATFEVWTALLNGARLVLYPYKNIDINLVNEQISKHSVTVAWFTSGLFEQWSYQSATCNSLRTVIAGGDVVNPLAVRRVYARLPSVLVVNGYGPTENTTFTCCYPVPRTFDDTSPLPIGKPVAGTNIYVVSKNNQLAPFGVPGELYVGGDGVARGYLNRPALTEACFVTNSFYEADRQIGDQRLYKTGDLVRYLHDGNLEYIGRSDDQVKIRGFRIELREIEFHLAQYGEIRTAAVLARQDDSGDKKLVAYVTLTSVIHNAGRHDVVGRIKSYLQSRLPNHMVPGFYMILDELPLTPNGKVDRKALPKPDHTTVLRQRYEAPVGAIELEVALVWQELLCIGHIGRNDHFFELGGHSLLAFRVISRLAQRLGVTVSVKDLFANPILEFFARTIAEHKNSLELKILGAERAQPIPLSSAQQRMWFLHHLDTAASVAYHMPAALRLRGRLNIMALKSALDSLVARHEMLRTTFVNDCGNVQQIIGEHNSGFNLSVVDLTSLSPQQIEAKASEIMNDEATRPFDFEKESMVRGRLLIMSKNEHIFLITHHHIISDGWSIAVLKEELSTLYDAFCRGNTVSMASLPLQYADYAIWQHNWLQTEAPRRQLDFWKSYLEGAPDLLKLPTDRVRPKIQRYRGGVIDLLVTRELTENLRDVSRRYGVTLFTTLLAAWSILMSKLSGQDDIVTGVPVANRPTVDLEPLIGFFVNTLAIRVFLGGDPKVSDLLEGVGVVASEAFSNQDIPFEKVVEAIRPTRNLTYSPIFQTMLTMNNVLHTVQFTLGNIEVREIVQTHGTSKFDLYLGLTETPNSIEGRLEYDSDLFSDETAKRFARYYQEVLSQIASEPGARLGEIELISRTEINSALESFNEKL